MTTARSCIVDVVIPMYNAEASIADAIESVLAQSQRLCCINSIIVVDDASTDRSREVAAAYDVKLATLKANSGVAVARNIGVRAAETPLVAFLDSDDAWLPQHLDMVVKTLREAEAALVYASEVSEDHSAHTESAEHPSERVIDPLEVARSLRGSRSCSGWLVDREIFESVGGFDEGFRRFQDYEFVIRLGLQGHSIIEVLSGSFVYHGSEERLRHYRPELARAMTLLASKVDPESGAAGYAKLATDDRLLLWQKYLRHAAAILAVSNSPDELQSVMCRLKTRRSQLGRPTRFVAIVGSRLPRVVVCVAKLRMVIRRMASR
jgi:glycosyltransferase involved in cell wall biosynthesis